MVCAGCDLAHFCSKACKINPYGIAPMKYAVLRTYAKYGASESAAGNELTLPLTQQKRRQKMRMNDKLTERELEIYRDIAEGLSYKEIAQKEFITITTAKTHVNRIYQKLGFCGESDPRAKMITDYWRKRLERERAECEGLRKVLDEVGTLIENALDPEKTPGTAQSINALYKALSITDKAAGMSCGAAPADARE